MATHKVAQAYIAIVVNEQRTSTQLLVSMAADTQSLPLSNGTSPAAEPIQLALPLPNAPHMRIHLHLTILATTLILFVTSAGSESTGGSVPMGSFVYAMPDVRYNVFSMKLY